MIFLLNRRKSSVCADPCNKADAIIEEEEDSVTLENSASDKEGVGGDAVPGFKGCVTLIDSLIA